MKRYISELLGTMVLVLFGCGSAAIAGSILGTFGIAMAFGLSIIAMAYVIGDISGCHINPAVSIGMWIDGRLDSKDLLAYIVFQCIGAIIGIALLVVSVPMYRCNHRYCPFSGNHQLRSKPWRICCNRPWPERIRFSFKRWNKCHRGNNR